MRTLSNKEIRTLSESIHSHYGVFGIIPKKEIIQFNHGMYFSQNQPLLFDHEGILIPTLKLLAKNQFLKTVEIDKGAIPFMIKGADLMRPGIVSFDPSIEKNTIVAIVDTVYKKPLAIGKTLYNAAEISTMQKGVIVKNIHYIGDKIWLMKG